VYQTTPCAEEGQQHDARVAPFEEAFGVGALGDRAFLLQLLERGALFELQANPDRDREQGDRDQERDAPAPFAEIIFAHEGARAEHDPERADQAE
jgi:hypothetical protein